MPPPELVATDPSAAALPGEARVATAAEQSLSGERRGARALWPFLGPAFIAAVAYVDPGNFATNIAAGSKYGYLLLWVILASNLMAMLIQTMSAKLGIATGMNLPEVCRQEFKRPVTIGLWIQAELVAMATDLAEFIGAALGLNLLFGIPLLLAGALTGVFAFALLALQTKGGFRHLEAAIVCLVGIIVAGFAFQMFHADPNPGQVAHGLFVPGFSGTESVVLAAGILGATVMPHVIYLHSALTQSRVVGRSDRERLAIFRFERIDVIIAMTVAGFVNMSMLIAAAGIFHAGGLDGVDTIEGAYARIPERGRRSRRDLVWDRASGVGPLLILGGDAGGPGRDAGLRAAVDSTVRAPAHDDGAGDGGTCDRCQPDSSVGVEPGGAVVRDSVRTRAAGAVLPQPPVDGGADESSRDHGGRICRRDGDRRAEYFPARADILRLSG